MGAVAGSLITDFTPQARPRVLAVDDQPDALRLIQLRLESGGMECFAHPDGPSALAFLKENPVDVIILDVMMPRMDGYEVCRKIKSNERTRDIPVIFLTAKMEVADRVQGLDVGAHDYLTKPIQQSELLARTRAAFRVKQLQDQLREQIQLQAHFHQLHRGMLSEHWQKIFGQLAGSLAHEINNPLAVALGTVQLLRMQSGVDERIVHSLRTVDVSLQRAAEKLRSLLIIAQAGRHRQKLSLNRLLRDLITLINYQVVMSKVTLTSDLDSECEWQGIGSDLARSVLYILNNALEAVEGCPNPTIRISAGQRSDHLFISVADNGQGVDESLRSRVFEPFFTTKGSPHHGVGLYLAHEIVKSNGGEIQLRSNCGDMVTEFIVILPPKAPE
jgi:DNA-binding response OmpR family regulator